MCPSLCAQLGLHEREMLRAAGITPIPTSIERGWRALDHVCTDQHPWMRQDVLGLLQNPGTYALLEGSRGSGFLWWDEGWVWERWHWNRWPVELLRAPLHEIAARAGANTERLIDLF